MLELVIGQLLDLGVVAFGDQVEVGLTLLVPRQAYVHDLPADRLSVVDRRERVTEPRSVRTEASKRTELFAAVRMPGSAAQTAGTALTTG